MVLFTSVSWHQNQNHKLHPHLHPHPLKAQGGCEVPFRRAHMACDSAILRWIVAHVSMLQKRVVFLETTLDTDARASEPQTPRWRVETLPPASQVLGSDCRSNMISARECAYRAQDWWNCRARHRRGRADAAHGGGHCSDRREATAFEEKIGRARQCRKRADVGQLEEDSTQINEKILDLILVTL